MAWSPDGWRLASASDDNTVRLWDPHTGQSLRTLEGHSDEVWSVAWCKERNVQKLASASYDKTVRIWDAETAQVTNVLEGHTGWLQCAEISRDSRLIASKGSDEDKTVRLWRCDTWQPVAVIPEPASAYWPPSVAFHPHEPALATVGSDPGTKRGECDRLIHIWQLDYAVLLGEDRSRTRESSGAGSLTTFAMADSVLYAAAKIVLVGDSGVGKTGLGWRLAHGGFKHHASTHGTLPGIVAWRAALRGDGRL